MFVIWGTLHGAAIVVHRIWKDAGYRMHILPAWLLTFVFINIAWVFFRADNLSSALNILVGMFDIYSLASFEVGAFKFVAIGLFLIFMKNSTYFTKKFKPNFFYLFITYTLLYVSLMQLSKSSDFIYFNF